MKYVLPLALLISLSTSSFAQEARGLNQAIHYIKLANTLRAVHKSDESISLLKRALPAVESKNLYWEAVTNELLGLSYSDLDDSKTAVRYLEIARGQYAKLKYVASAWGVNEVIRDISGKNLYAGVQIGASDVKLAIFKTQYESDFYEKDIRSVITIPNETMVADASGLFAKSQIALKTCLDSIRKYNIPAERTFIVFSSDVLGAGKGIDKNRMYEQLANVLPEGSSMRIDTTLTAAREAELFTIGAIPRKVWPSTSALNIGSNTIMGGYFNQGVGQNDRTFRHFSAPVGVNTVVEKIDGKRSTSISAYRQEAQQVVKTIAETSLTPQIRQLEPRRTIGIGGPIVRALITYLHPEKALTTAVPISADDVDRFKQLALNDYEALLRPNLASIADPTVRDRAEQDIRSLQNQLTQKQLIAGALLLDATFKAYANHAGAKRFVFVRDSEIGWVTGKFWKRSTSNTNRPSLKELYIRGRVGQRGVFMVFYFGR